MGKKEKTKKRRSPACKLLWLYIWNVGEWLCFYGTGHLWIGDPGILRHLIGSHLCSVPPLQAAEQKSHQAAAVRGKPLLTADLLSSARLSTGPVWTTIPTPSLQLRRADTVCVRQWRGGDLGWGVEGGEVGGGCRFLCYCLVLKGRSQLSILRLRGEKAPYREVRYPLRNRNYCAFYPLPGHTFRCAFRPFLLVFFTCGVRGGGGEYEYVGWHATPCNSILMLRTNPH